MKTFIKFIIPAEGEPEGLDFEEWEEKYHLKLNNHRELVLNEAGEVVEVSSNQQLAGGVGDKKSNAGRNS